MKTLTLAEQVVEAFSQGQTLSLGVLKREELSELVSGIKELMG